MNVAMVHVVMSLLVAVVVSGACGAADDADLTAGGLVTGPVVQRFGGGWFTEGPAVDGGGKVYFSDQIPGSRPGGPRGRIWRFDPSTGDAVVVIEPSGMANGLAFDHDGLLVAAEGADSGGRRIARYDVAGEQAVVLADRYEGRLLNSPNDLVVDRRGGIYFTDPRYTGDEPIEQPVRGVYRIDPSGAVALVAGDVTRPNGVALSPDETTLYVAHDNYLWTEPSARTRVLAYGIGQDGAVTFKADLFDFSGEGSPDGMAVDAEGHVYVAVYELNAISIHDPDGRRRGLVRLPEPPTNVAFGRGRFANTLYVTAGGGLYSVDVAIPGYYPSPRP